MIKLYIIWTIIYLPITIYNFKKNNFDISTSVKIFIKGIVFVGENWYSWPLWYLLSTIYGIIVIYILLKCKKEKFILPISTIIFILSFVIDKIIIKTDLTGDLLKFKNGVDLTIVNGRILRGIFYLSLGMTFSKYNEKIQKINYIYILIINIILLALSIITKRELIIQMYYIMFFLLILKINIKDNFIYYYLRCGSKIIYFVHMIIFFIWTISKGLDKCYGLRAFVFTSIISTAFSVCILIINKKKDIKALKLIFN